MNTNQKYLVTAAVVSVLIGASFGAIISAALLAVSAMIFVKSGNVPVQAAPIIAGCISAIGSFCAGYITVKLCKSKGMLMGAISGLLFFSAAVLCSAISGELSFSAATITKGLIFVISGAVGGIVRVNKRTIVKRTPI